MIDSNRRIFLAIFLSLVIFFCIRYVSLNPAQFNPSNIYAGITQKTTEIKTNISSFKFPDLIKIFSFNIPNFSRLFTFNYSPVSNQPLQQYNNGAGNNGNSFTVPTQTYQPYQPPQGGQQFPTVAGGLVPTRYYFYPTSIVRPTTIIQPTSRPQPTTAPQPTAVPEAPPVTSNVRPGTTLEEIFQEVNKRICVPVALLRAIQEEETGTWLPYNTSSSTIKNYNEYGWWQTGAGDPCYGFGYNTATGIVPSDSVKAGIQCKNAVGGDDLKIMGILQVSQWEQDTTRKNTLAILPNNIDRRVMFDNAIIVASAIINQVVEPPCGEVWSDDVVHLAAEKHIGTGGCQQGSVNYCDDVVAHYKEYR